MKVKDNGLSERLAAELARVIASGSQSDFSIEISNAKSLQLPIAYNNNIQQQCTTASARYCLHREKQKKWHNADMHVYMYVYMSVYMHVYIKIYSGKRRNEWK